MHEIDSTVAQKFVKLLGDSLAGDWLVVGGTVLPLLGVKHRVTLDIDIVKKNKASQADTIALMELARSLNLPVETINQAATFFVNKITDWKKNLIPLYEGNKSTVFRPNATLFLLLKLGRMSPSDLTDCLQMLKFASRHKELIDRDRVLNRLHEEIEKEQSELRAARLETLVEKLGS